MNNSTQYEIYTDGSCNPNGFYPNVGKYGFMVYNGNDVIHTTIVLERNTTNNRMELLAGINALKFLKQNKAKGVIYTDSQYFCKGFTLWMYNWAKKDFKKGIKDIPNKDLWLQLFKLKNVAKVKWIKGHSTNHRNNAIDKLVNDLPSP